MNIQAVEDILNAEIEILQERFAYIQPQGGIRYLEYNISKLYRARNYLKENDLKRARNVVRYEHDKLRRAQAYMGGAFGVGYDALDRTCIELEKARDIIKYLMVINDVKR